MIRKFMVLNFYSQSKNSSDSCTLYWYSISCFLCLNFAMYTSISYMASSLSL